MSLQAIASRLSSHVHRRLSALHVELAGQVAAPLGHVTALARAVHSRAVQRLMFVTVRQPIDGGVQTLRPSSRGKHSVFGGQGVPLFVQSTRHTPSLLVVLHVRPLAQPLLQGSSHAPMSSESLCLLQRAPGAAVEQSVGSDPTVQIASITAGWQVVSTHASPLGHVRSSAHGNGERSCAVFAQPVSARIHAKALTATSPKMRCRSWSHSRLH